MILLRLLVTYKLNKSPYFLAFVKELECLSPAGQIKKPAKDAADYIVNMYAPLHADKPGWTLCDALGSWGGLYVRPTLAKELAERHIPIS